jgi:hypothetical protein
MILRFKYGSVNNEYQYEDKKLKIIDEHLDENKIRSLFALGYKSCHSEKGRLPLDPVISYKAHLLYFLKRDTVSFNELPEKINKDTDYRVFCRCQGVSFTPGYLSLFRKYHLTSEMAAQLHQDIFDSLNDSLETAKRSANEEEAKTEAKDCLRIGIWDSVPMPSYSSPYKDTKHCKCQKPCKCPKYFSDKDASIGWQSGKPNRKDKFLGYRKHTVLTYDPDKSKRLPIVTTAQTATTADIEVIEELLRLCKGKLDILLVDRAIYDFEQINKWYLLYDILVIVRPKSNAVLPDYSLSDTGTPCCPQMDEPLDWSYLDSEDNVHVYNCIKTDCIYEHVCQRQFEIPMSQHPALLGAFPAHTRCGRLLLSLRKLIEPEFGVQTLWSRLKSLPFRRLHNFKLLSQLIDTVHLLKKLSQGFSICSSVARRNVKRIQHFVVQEGFA